LPFDHDEETIKKTLVNDKAFTGGENIKIKKVVIACHIDKLLAHTQKVASKKQKVRRMQVQEVKKKTHSQSSLDDAHNHNLAASVYHHQTSKQKKLDLKDFSPELQKEFEELRQLHIDVKSSNH
jgi:hypothetical protein